MAQIVQVGVYYSIVPNWMKCLQGVPKRAVKYVGKYLLRNVQIEVSSKLQ